VGNFFYLLFEKVRLFPRSACPESSPSLSAMSDKGPELERGLWVAVIIALLIVILRIFAKIKINRFFVDDVLMIIAVVCIVLLLAYTHTDSSDSRLWQLPPQSSSLFPFDMALESHLAIPLPTIPRSFSSISPFKSRSLH
jgi:amino acid permease